MVLGIQNVSFSFGEKRILNKINIRVEDHQKVALIGDNGTGKSTLLKLILGNLTPEDGVISLKKDATIGYLAQHQDYSSDRTVYEELLEVMSETIAMEDKIRQMEEGMNNIPSENLEEYMDKYHKLLHSFDLAGGYTYKSDIIGILHGLNFDDDDFDKKSTSLSGGERTRLLLGRILLKKPDLILLDEPTNYLDVSSVEWLENYLLNIPSAVLVVSHDRYFINKTCSSIAEIFNCEAMQFDGNFDEFKAKKEQVLLALTNQYNNQQREIKHQQEVIAKLRSFNREKSIKRADSRQKMLEKIDVIDKPVADNNEMQLFLTPDTLSGNDVLSVKNISKSYGDRTLFDNLSFEIKRGEHIALIGDNGCGKTTILKIINGLLESDNLLDDNVKLGSKVTVGYFDQQSAVLDETKTIFDEISDAYPKMTQTEIRNTMASFLFTEDEVFKTIKLLSGGERSRVVLAKIMLSKSNFLILDEPTNHLDMSSKAILEEAIKGYEGTVLYVSHDRYFINETADKILCLHNNELTEYLGNYDYYLEKKAEATIPQANNNSKESLAIPEPQTENKLDWAKQKEEQARIRKIQNRINKIEEEIENLETKISDLETQMCDPVNVTNSVKLQELATEANTCKERLENLYAEWEELSS